MDKNNLLEIKKGQVGTGLLIEHDGYIQLTEQDRALYESSKLNEDSSANVLASPFIVSAVFQKYGIPNANNRIYPESILKREVEKYQIKIKERRAYGELNHPADTAISLDRICMNIIELHWEEHTLVGKIEIPITQGFKKYGVISCLADTVAHWILCGLKIGVSSRGLGSVEQRLGKLIVGDDYELVCWDVVSDPSTPGAWIGNSAEELQQYVENTQKDNNTILKENKYKEINEWLGII